MLYSNVTKKYIEAQNSINQSRQIVMLYDGLIKIINQAIESMKQKDIQTRYNLLERASLVINGLQGSLDFNKGGNVAQLLDDYYFSIYMRIMNVNSSNSSDYSVLENVLGEILMMRDAWHEVDDTVAKEVLSSENTKELTQGLNCSA